MAIRVVPWIYSLVAFTLRETVGGTLSGGVDFSFNQIKFKFGSVAFFPFQPPPPKKKKRKERLYTFRSTEFGMHQKWTGMPTG